CLNFTISSSGSYPFPLPPLFGIAAWENPPQKRTITNDQPILPKEPVITPLLSSRKYRGWNIAGTFRLFLSGFCLPSLRMLDIGTLYQKQNVNCQQFFVPQGR